MNRPLNASVAFPVERRAERTHLFLVAMLAHGSAATPVRVRNLSEVGALIEASVIPPKGTAVVLRRGNLEASGHIAWTVGGKAGLVFRDHVVVSGWLPAKQPPDPKADIGAEKSAFRIDGKPTAASIADELGAVRRTISLLSDQLLQDAAVLAKFPDLRLLGEAAREIGRLAAALRNTHD